MSISLRILLGFGFSTLLLIVLGIYVLDEIGEVRDVTTTIVSRDITAYRQTNAVHDAQDDLSTLRLAATNRYIRRVAGLTIAPLPAEPGAGPADVEAGIAECERQATVAEATLATARQSVSTFAELARSRERRQAWTAISVTLQQADEMLRQIRRDTDTQFSAMRRGDTRAVLIADATLFREHASFDHLLDHGIATLDAGVQVGQDRVQTLYENSRISVLLALLAAVAAAATITLLIHRSIARPLAAFLETMGLVGRGDLSVHALGSSVGEIQRLGVTLNRMVEGLRVIARESREGAENLNASVTEIRASTQQQAAGFEEQLAAVQETAATVDQIAHSGAQISRRAQEVIASVQSTTLASAGGLHAVRETGRAMELVQVQGEAVAANIVGLSEKTQAIGEIVTSVNDISERSHLLALNAAIEAAAAGEHGRSFAVVAAEMKILADQAKQATTQVRSILGDIQRGINTSVMLTEEAVKRGAAGRERTETAEATIEQMAAGIQDAVQTFQQIVASTNQQQLGIEQVMTALQSIRHASQQTAAGTHQLDSAASGLGELSRRLLSVSERFRI